MPDDSSATLPPNLVETCFTCVPLAKYVGLTEDFVDRLGDVLHDPMLILFTSLSGLWIVLAGTKLHFQMTNFNKIFEEFVFISITGLILGSQGAGLISYVYSSAISIMGESSAAVFKLAADSQSTGQDGLMALAAQGEKAAAKVIQAASAIARAGSAMNVMNYVYAAILVLPYLLLVVAYSSQVVVAIFRATMIGVFAPFLFMAFAFGWGRGMAQSGVKTLLASILVLFASTAALSLTVFGVNSSVLEPAELTGDRLNEFASITNPEFLVVMFLGWMGTALLTEGTSIANSIAGTMLTNSASGIMTTGVSGSAIAAGTLGKRGVIAGKNAAGGWGALGLLPVKGMAAVTGPAAAAVAATASSLVEKFQNINKPDSKA